MLRVKGLEDLPPAQRTREPSPVSREQHRTTAGICCDMASARFQITTSPTSSTVIQSATVIPALASHRSPLTRSHTMSATRGVAADTEATQSIIDWHLVEGRTFASRPSPESWTVNYSSVPRLIRVTRASRCSDTSPLAGTGHPGSSSRPAAWFLFSRRWTR